MADAFRKHSRSLTSPPENGVAVEPPAPATGIGADRILARPFPSHQEIRQ
jgi:hypothetical protein